MKTEGQTGGAIHVEPRVTMAVGPAETSEDLEASHPGRTKAPPTHTWRGLYLLNRGLRPQPVNDAARHSEFMVTTVGYRPQ